MLSLLFKVPSHHTEVGRKIQSAFKIKVPRQAAHSLCKTLVVV